MPESDPRRRWWAVPAVFVAALASYRLGMAPGLLWGDSAEMQTLTAVGGVAHPTGYPLFTLLAHAFAKLRLGEPAFMANLFSGVFAAATLALLVAFLLGRSLRLPAALAAALAWGLSFTYWTTSHRAEVYSLGAFVGLAALWCALLALGAPAGAAAGAGSGERRMRLFAGFLLGLTLCAHMAFAPVVAVTGLVLAWRVPRTGRAWLADELALLLAFLLGLAPYLYVVWADTHRLGLDYLHLVDLVQWPTKPVPEEFRSPLSRLWWLLTSRNTYPSMKFVLNVRLIAKNVSDTGCLLALFELGPIALVLAMIGFRRRTRLPVGRDAGPQASEARFLLALAAASVAFSLLTGGYMILSVFLIPCYLVFAIFVGHGMDALLERIEGRGKPWLAAPAALALPLASVLIAHAIRLATYDHPIGPFRSRVLEEDTIQQRTLAPTYAGYDPARRFVESAARTLPDSALVIAEWHEVMPLFYLQLAERRRTDLTLQPSGYPMLLDKVAEWQSRFTLERRPVVVVGPFAEMSRHLQQVDTLRLADERRVLVTRTPLVHLERP
jgi:hypothetical protein